MVLHRIPDNDTPTIGVAEETVTRFIQRHTAAMAAEAQNLTGVTPPSLSVIVDGVERNAYPITFNNYEALIVSLPWTDLYDDRSIYFLLEEGTEGWRHIGNVLWSRDDEGSSVTKLSRLLARLVQGN